MPSFAYTPEEVRVWRTVLDRLDEAHRACACSTYLAAKTALGISVDAIPGPGGINETLRKMSGFQLAGEHAADVAVGVHGRACHAQ